MKNTVQKRLQDFAFIMECEIIPRLKSVGFERNKHNIFNILRLNRQEIRHSAFLAFLMDPSQSENIGIQFLKHFLILLSNELDLDPSDIFKYEFEKVIVRQEHQHIDLLADIQIKNGKKILIVIENKIDSGERIGQKEGEGQLTQYRCAIEKEYYAKDYKKLFLFLTPDRRAPIRDIEHWISIDYKLIYDTICRLDLDAADPTIKTLINDYRKLIRSEFKMVDNELERQQQQAIDLYKKYRDVFDFVFECRPNRINKTAEVINEYLGKSTDWIVTMGSKTTGRNKTVCFTTKDLKELWRDTFKIYFQIDMAEMDLVCCVEGADDHTRRLLGYDKKSAVFRYGGKQWLVDNDIRRTADLIKAHDDYVLANRTELLKTEIESILSVWLARPQGWIIATSDAIKSRFNTKKERSQ